MSKKVFLILVSIIFFSFFNSARAEVVINEVQLSPTGERFVELYNGGSEAIDLTGWYIQRKTATGSSFGSLVSNPNFEGKTIGAGDYFVISRLPLSDSDLVLDNLTLTESNVIQIKNSDGEVVDLAGWGDASDCDSSCASNPSEGQSIQKTESSSWVMATPTPGGINEISATAPIDDVGDENDEDQSNQSTSNSEPKTKTTTVSKTKILKIKAQITVNPLAYVGIPLSFQGMVFGQEGEQLSRGRYFWNFGDGDFREVKVGGPDKFTHTYFYPGEYNIIFEYYPDHFSETPDASEKITVKVVSPTISISSVGNEVDFFVELSNDTGYAIDLSDWFLISDQKSFTIPRNTVLPSKKKMIVSSRISGFSVVDKNTLRLVSSQGEIIYDYSSSTLASTATPRAKVVAQPKMSPVGVQSREVRAVSVRAEESSDLSELNPDIPIENLSASIGSIDFEKGHPVRTYFLTAIFTIFLGVSAGVVYFIRKKKITRKAGDDFKILEE